MKRIPKKLNSLYLNKKTRETNRAHTMTILQLLLEADL
jgi:hypothetical protein